MPDKEEIYQKILDLALPLIEAQNLQLWGLELTSGPVLKATLYVDTPARNPGDASLSESPQSATIDQCEAISRQLGLALDVEDCIDQPWNLEVSSPGLERRFFNPGQLGPFMGDLLEVRLKEPVLDRKTWRGRLLGVEGEDILLEPCSISADGVVEPEKTDSVRLPWADVARAKRIHIFTLPKKPGKQPASRKK